MPPRMQGVPRGFGGDPAAEPIYNIDKSDFVLVCNVVPFGHYEVRQGGGPIDIPPSLDRDGYVQYHYLQRVTPTDRGDDEGNYFDFVVAAQRSAEDVIRQMTETGMFVQSSRDPACPYFDKENPGFCTCPPPNALELERARKLRHTWAVKLLGEAAEMWQRYRKTGFLSNGHRWAAEFLNAKPEWLVDSREKAMCPECESAVPMTATRCSCGFIFNWILAAERGLLRPDEIELGKRMGRFSINESPSLPVERRPRFTDGDTPAEEEEEPASP